MIYEYAVDPSLLSDLNKCRTIFDNFKPQQGKLISDAPRKWIREAFSAIQNIPEDQCQPLMRKTIKEHLKHLLRGSLCRTRQSHNWDRVNESWIDYVASEHSTYPFAATISGQSVSKPVVIHDISTLFVTSPECWRESSQKRIPRKAKDIVDALMPLLVISSQIVLIDMHLYPGDYKSLRVLKEIIARSESYNFGQGISRLLVHSSDHRRDLQSSLEQQLLPHLPNGFEVVYKLWPKAIEHDRFAITNAGGINLGEGFDEQTHVGTDTVLLSLIDLQTRLHLNSKFSSQASYIASISK